MIQASFFLLTVQEKDGICVSRVLTRPPEGHSLVQRDTAKDTETYPNQHLAKDHTHTHTHQERDSEREREGDGEGDSDRYTHARCAHMHTCKHTVTDTCSGQH
jgi:hypothetical protein